MQRSYANGGCCFESGAPAVDPTAVENVIPAGGVASANPCGMMTGGNGCPLATAYFPSQAYRAGFCPCEALSRGTLFPELVSEYPTCRNREANV